MLQIFMILFPAEMFLGRRVGNILLLRAFARTPVTGKPLRKPALRLTDMSIFPNESSLNGKFCLSGGALNALLLG